MHLQRPHPCNASQQRPPPAPPIAAPHSTPATPHPHLRKINCSFAIAIAENFAVVGCGVLRGVLYAFQLRCFSSASAAPQNQANCNAQKFAWWAARCYKGLVPESLLKVRLRCKASHASNSATPHPQLRKIKLHLAECTRRKSA